MGLLTFRMIEQEHCMECKMETCKKCKENTCYYCNINNKCNECPKNFVNLDMFSSDLTATNRLNLMDLRYITNPRLWGEK
jgi:hypothetical protein